MIRKQKMGLSIISAFLGVLLLCSEMWLVTLIGAVLLIAGGVGYFRSARCPSCGEFLGKYPGDYCKHCGTQIDWDKE